MGKNLLLLIVCFLLQFLLFASGKDQLFTDPPQVIISEPGVTVYYEGDGAVKVDGDLEVLGGSSLISGAEVTLTQILDNALNEPLFFTSKGIELISQYELQFSRQYTPTATISISGEASVSVYQQILREFTYSNNQVPATPGERLATYVIYNSEGISSTPVGRIISVQLPPVEIEDSEVINLPPNGLYGIGDIIELQVNFSKEVFLSGGTPYIVLNINGAEVRAEYKSGSGSDQLVFAYVVEEGLLGLEGIGNGGSIELNGANMIDGEGNDAPLGISIDTGGILVDGIRPFVGSMSVPQERTYGLCQGDILMFTLHLNEGVTFDLAGGIPSLQLQLGSGQVLANFDETSSTSEQMVFQYQIKDGDMALEGISFGAIVLNGASIKDVASNEFIDVKLESADIPDTGGIFIDTHLPQPPAVTGISEDTGVSDTDGITSSQNLTIFGTGPAGAEITVYLDNAEIGKTIAGDNGDWSFDYTETTLGEGKYLLTARSINAQCAESTESAPFEVLVDITPPTANLQEATVSLDAEGKAVVGKDQIDNGSGDNFTPSLEIVFTFSQEEFDCEDLGENEVTVTLVDLSGNITTETITLTIVDDIAPSVNVEDFILYLDEDGTVGFSAEDIGDIAFDNCGVASVSFDKEEFGCEDLGDNEVTVTITDGSGNESVTTFNVKVVDQLGPVIEGVPANFNAGTNVDGEYTVPDFLPELTVSDNCEVNSIRQYPEAGAVLTEFDTPHTIRFVATDISGNETEVVFTITLIDNSIKEILMPEIMSVPWNTPVADLLAPEAVNVILRNGKEETVGVNWVFDNYSPMEPGLYQNSGAVILPDNIFNPENLKPIINVLVEDKPLPLDVEIDRSAFQMDIRPNREIGTFSTIDPSDDIHTYALVGEGLDNLLFRVSDGKLYWISEEQHPGRTEFQINVSSTDRMGNVITKTFTITRTFTPLADLRIVNVFSPNGDGINDTWGVEVLGFYGGVRIMVYERSGKRVYYSTDPYERWDGKFMGQDVVGGTYYYIIEVMATKEVHRSVLTILRD
jgi:gliding motility-associated-like protein